MKKNYIYQSVGLFSLVMLPVLAFPEADLVAVAEKKPDSRTIDGGMLTDDRDKTSVPEGAAERPQHPDEIALQQTISQYAELILQHEIENGAYNNDLSEALIGLGNAYNMLGEHEQALNVYTRALHINRINEGLQNLNQLPILELIINANTELGDYKNLANNYDYMLWVYHRNYHSDDPALIPVYQKIGDWHLQAYEQTVPPDSISHIVMATNLFSKSIEVIEANQGPFSPDLITPLYGVVSANFKLIEPYGFIPNVDSFIGGKLMPLLPSDFDSGVPDSSFRRNNYMALDYDHDRLNRLLADQKHTASLIQNSYKSGRNALERIVEIYRQNPGLPRISYAYALTHLGDWYLRFYKRSNATASYEQAYQLLTQDGYDTDGEDGFFSYPRSLDRFGNAQLAVQKLSEDSALTASLQTQEEEAETDSGQALDKSTDDESSFVLVQFNVTEYGAVRNLDIIDANPSDNIRFRRMARDRIASTPFRPRLENGKPTLTEDVRMLYRFQ